MNPIRIIESINKDDFELESKKLYDQGYKLSSSHVSTHIIKGLNSSYTMYHGIFECHDRYHKSHDAILNNKVIQEYEIKAILKSIIEKINKFRKENKDHITLQEDCFLLMIIEKLSKIIG